MNKMKITKRRLKQIIKEEKAKVLSERVSFQKHHLSGLHKVFRPQLILIDTCTYLLTKVIGSIPSNEMITCCCPLHVEGLHPLPQHIVYGQSHITVCVLQPFSQVAPYGAYCPLHIAI